MPDESDIIFIPSLWLWEVKQPATADMASKWQQEFEAR